MLVIPISPVTTNSLLSLQTYVRRSDKFVFGQKCLNNIVAFLDLSLVHGHIFYVVMENSALVIE